MRTARTDAKEFARRRLLSTKRAIERRAVGETDHRPLGFVIIFSARSGSNMLRSALDGHPNIRCEREIFRHRAEAAAGQHVYPASRTTGRLLVERPIDFLETELFGHQPRSVHARGFKLAYGHAREPEWECVWNYVQTSRMHVIQMRRRNLLAALVSRERALRSGSFVAGRADQELSPVELSIEQCHSYFDATARKEAEAERSFADNPRIVVDYEDLLDERTEVLRQVQEFLAVPPRELSPQTRRQSTWQPEKQIANFAELETAFAGTPYHRFLHPDR